MTNLMWLFGHPDLGNTLSQIKLLLEGHFAFQDVYSLDLFIKKIRFILFVSPLVS